MRRKFRTTESSGLHCVKCKRELKVGEPRYPVSLSGSFNRCKQCENEWFKKTFPEQYEAEKRHEQRIAKIRFHESKLVEEVKKHNEELRKWIKWIEILVIAPLFVIALIVQFIDYDWLTRPLVIIAGVGGYSLYWKYKSLKKRNLITCENCAEEFVPKDSEKRCPYCRRKHIYYL